MRCTSYVHSEKRGSRSKWKCLAPLVPDTQGERCGSEAFHLIADPEARIFEPTWLYLHMYVSYHMYIYGFNPCLHVSFSTAHGHIYIQNIYQGPYLTWLASTNHRIVKLMFHRDVFGLSLRIRSIVAGQTNPAATLPLQPLVKNAERMSNHAECQ